MPKVTVNLPNRTLVAGAHCAPCESRRLGRQAMQVTAAAPIGDETPTTDDAPQADVRWSGVLCQEGIATGDGRFMSPGSLRWDTLPMPLRWDEFDDGEHAGAVVVGTIDTMERRANGDIYATGMIDASGKYGREVIRLMAKGMLQGVSVDMDDMDIELRVKPELLGLNEDGSVPEGEDAVEPAEPEGAEVDDEGRVKVMDLAMDDEMMVVMDARIRGATLVDIPAFEGARLFLDDPDQVDADTEVEDDDEDAEALLASAYPVDPPRAWFADPKLSGPTPLTFTDDGRVYGHIAVWGTCHIGHPGTCITPPKSAIGYSWFTTGEVVTAEGDHIPTGRLTFDTGHAPRIARPMVAAAHYDNTGRCGADLAIGEDAHGIWVAGAVRPDITPAQMRVLRGSPYSGDWRDRNGQLELVGVLGVNIPGFPVPRHPRALVASGRVASLVLPIPSRVGAPPATEVEALPKPGPSATLRKRMLLRRLGR